MESKLYDEVRGGGRHEGVQGAAESEADSLIRAELHTLGVEAGTEYADLTSLPNEAVLEFFSRLARSGSLVLHGTNADHPYAILEPRRANDSSKESGNKNAVYATVDTRAALYHAIFNQEYVREKLSSYTWGEETRTEGGKILEEWVNMSPELYALFKEHDPNVLSDGFVYALDRRSFVSAPDAGDIEFHSESEVTPVAACKVSKRLGDVLFVVGQGEKDTVREYTPEQMRDMAAARDRRAKKNAIE
jgi:hypothetical protein